MRDTNQPAPPDKATATRDRVRAIKAQQRAARLEVSDLPMAAASYATLTSAHHADRLDASAAALDEMRGGGITRHSLTGKER